MKGAAHGQRDPSPRTYNQNRQDRQRAQYDGSKLHIKSMIWRRKRKIYLGRDHIMERRGKGDTERKKLRTGKK